MASVNELFANNKPAAVGIVLALVLAGWLCWHFSDRQVIKRQLIGLSWDVSKKSRQESTMETALKMRTVKAALAADCRVTVPETRFNDTLARDMAVMYLLHYRDRYEMLSAVFTELRIDFPAKGEAAVQGQARLTKQKHQETATTEVSALLRLTLKKEDGDWLLTQVEIPAAFVD